MFSLSGLKSKLDNSAGSAIEFVFAFQTFAQTKYFTNLRFLMLVLNGLLPRSTSIMKVR